MNSIGQKSIKKKGGGYKGSEAGKAEILIKSKVQYSLPQHLGLNTEHGAHQRGFNGLN